MSMRTPRSLTLARSDPLPSTPGTSVTASTNLGHGLASVPRRWPSSLGAQQSTVTPRRELHTRTKETVRKDTGRLSPLATCLRDALNRCRQRRRYRCEAARTRQRALTHHTQERPVSLLPAWQNTRASR
jgi:hypothetical protein